MMHKVVYWNIRSVNNQNSFERVSDLNERHHYSFITLLEPFQEPDKLEEYKNRLCKQNALVNISGKIWIFWDDGWQQELIEDNEQHITVKLSNSLLNQEVAMTTVYAK